MQFRYVAYTLAQGVVKGQVEAATLGEARAKVASQGCKPLRLRPAKRLPGLEALFPSLFRLGSGELIRFSRYLSAMLTSGCNLVRTLEILQRETRSRLMRRTVEAIRKTLDEGGSLSAALSQHPSVFTPLFISVVEVGEYTGRLGPALEQMADILEQSQEAKQKVIRALMYPAAIIALALVTMSVLMLVAMPPMLKVFNSMGAQVPLITRVSVMLFSQVKDRFLVLALGAVAAAILLMLLRRIPRVRYWMDAAQLRAPLLGPVVIAGELSRFSRTMTLLLEAGVPLATALRLGISGCKNRVLRGAFAEAEESLLSGHGLASALKKYPVFPSMFVELVTIGEESNLLRRAMNDAAVSYQKQLERRLNSLLGVLEPVCTLVIGGVVGLLAFSMFLPIYSGLQAIK